MLAVTNQQVHTFLAYAGQDKGVTYAKFLAETDWTRGTCPVDKTMFLALRKADIREIITDENMSETNLGGDDVVSIVDDTVTALNAGYTVATWYGPDTEVLVFGYRPNQLTILPEPPG